MTPLKLAPSEVSRDSVQVVLRESTSISPDCSAVKRSLADSGTNLTLVGSSKIAAATARQTSTSIPVQLPLSSGEENPGRPWLTPQDNSPRSLTVLSVCAVAALVERPAARARVKTSDTRFMAKPFKCRPGDVRLSSRASIGQTRDLPPQPPTRKAVECADTLEAMDQRSRQAPQRAAPQ